MPRAEQRVSRSPGGPGRQTQTDRPPASRRTGECVPGAASAHRADRVVSLLGGPVDVVSPLPAGLLVDLGVRS
jgi:hypothetical protein